MNSTAIRFSFFFLISIINIEYLCDHLFQKQCKIIFYYSKSSFFYSFFN